ncbi:Uncharacterised protein [uncultured archaeon]|nr:Uncharacterised protein [uncultured archaeon]
MPSEPDPTEDTMLSEIVFEPDKESSLIESDWLVIVKRLLFCIVEFDEPLK